MSSTHEKVTRGANWTSCLSSCSGTRAIETVAETRRRVCAWRASFEPQSWSTLYGWLKAVAGGRLFGRVMSSPPSFSYRQRAERTAAALVAMAPVSLAQHSPEDQVFAGAALAA